jgi:hypothetical protein
MACVAGVDISRMLLESVDSGSINLLKVVIVRYVTLEENWNKTEKLVEDVENDDKVAQH